MKGMAAEYLEKMGDLLGVAFEPGEPRTWREMLVAVEKGELDFFSAIAPTSRRREWIEFTDTYLSFPIVVLTSKEVAYIGEISDLAGKTVAVVDGYASHDILLEKHPDLTLLPVKGVKEGLMAVSTGEAFAFVGSLATASHVISREGLADLKVSGKTPYAYDVAMGTRKENAVLVKILNKALASVSAQEKNAIYGRWTSVTFEHATDYSLFWRVIVAALVVVLFVLLWNWRLKKEIVERKHAEKAAENANLAKSTFLASMSHELRTPLNTLLGFTNIVAKSDNLSAEDRENLVIVRRSGEHLLTLINDILDLSRIEAGKVGLNEEVFDLHHLLDDLNLMFERKTRKKRSLSGICPQAEPAPAHQGGSGQAEASADQSDRKRLEIHQAGRRDDNRRFPGAVGGNRVEDRGRSRVLCHRGYGAGNRRGRFREDFQSFLADRDRQTFEPGGRTGAVHQPTVRSSHGRRHQRRKPFGQRKRLPVSHRVERVLRGRMVHRARKPASGQAGAGPAGMPDFDRRRCLRQQVFAGKHPRPGRFRGSRGGRRATGRRNLASMATPPDLDGHSHAGPGRLRGHQDHTGGRKKQRGRPGSHCHRGSERRCFRRTAG